MLDSCNSNACLSVQRRSNRIASQQQSDHIGELSKDQQPKQKQRRRKQGRPSISVSAASVSNNVLLIASCLTDAAAVAAVNSPPQSPRSHILICFDCRYATLSLSAYTQHMTSRHDLMPADVRVYCCPHCQFLASESDILAEHLALAGHDGAAVADASVVPRYLAEQSEAPASSPLLASDVTAAEANADSLPCALPRSSGLPHACDSCDKRFRLRYQLTRHRHRHHQQQQQQQPPPPSSSFDDAAKQLKSAAIRKTKNSTGAGAISRSPLKLACRLCCKLFKSSRSYQLHRLAFHASESSAAVAADAAASITASCVLDGVGSRVGADCLIVSDPEPFKCRYCDLKFAQKTAFAKHLARDHPAERPYQCGQCGRGFKFPHSLAMHERFHLGELTCGQCAKLFHSDREFREHMASVHEGSLTFLCESCGRTFPTQYRLNRHSRCHNRARQLACPECGRLFHRADKLKLHLDCVHSDLRPHLCHLCGRAYNRRDKLALHIKQHQRVPADGAGGRRRQRRPQQPNVVGTAVAADAAPPAQQLPMPQQPPHSPLGDALISIANGCLDVVPDVLQQHQQPQDIFFESFDQPQLQQQQQLGLYSPVSRAFFGATDGSLLQ